MTEFPFNLRHAKRKTLNPKPPTLEHLKLVWLKACRDVEFALQCEYGLSFRGQDLSDVTVTLLDKPPLLQQFGLGGLRL